jgi:hypothetical protein
VRISLKTLLKKDQKPLPQNRAREQAGFLVPTAEALCRTGTHPRRATELTLERSAVSACLRARFCGGRATSDGVFTEAHGPEALV